jgi:uncharacterized repeat protein (TIGR01451 family)
VRAEAALAFRLLEVAESGRLTLHDLTLQNGTTPGDGGALHARSAVTLTQVTFLHNTALRLGGAVYGEGAVLIRDSRFEQNTSNRGGAGYVQTAAVIEDTTFLSNTAQVNGGGLYAVMTTTVRNSHFAYNGSIEGEGGGLYALHGKTTIAGATFTHNAAGVAGGGAVIWDGDVTVSRSHFEQNTAGGYGGGLFVYQALSLTSSVFLANAGSAGGGLYVGHTDVSGTTYIVNSLFARNRAEQRGAALFLMPFWGRGGNAEIVNATITSPTLASQTAVSVDLGRLSSQNNILTHHAIALAAGQNVTVTDDHNLYYANLQNHQWPVQGHELLNADPLFVDPLNDNYRLKEGSPALDSAPNLGLTIDLEGTPRPGTGSTASDRGAYERQNVMANLVLRKTVAFPAHLPQPSPGAPLTYTLVVSNAGSGIATGIVLTDVVPAAFSELTVASTPAIITDTLTNPRFVWRMQDLTPGMSWFVTLTGILDPDLPEGTILTNSASVAALQESTLADNTAAVSVTVMPAEGVVYLPIVVR